MTTEQRFQRVERELDEVRQLLASAATHAEAANRNYNQLAGKVDNTKSEDILFKRYMAARSSKSTFTHNW
ncbi:MAG: hypothetical protein AAFV71_14660 [Cyanobacteria bacterium J06633_8]